MIHIPVLCSSSELSTFLSRSNISLPAPDALAGLRKQFEALPGRSVVRSFYQTLTAGLSGPSLLDALVTGLRQQAVEFQLLGGPNGNSDDVLSSSMHLERSATGDTLASLPTAAQPIDGELVTAFTAPICNFIVEIFELNDKNQWLRKQGIVILLQQVLGSAIERWVFLLVTSCRRGADADPASKMRETLSANFEPGPLVRLLSAFENML